MANKTKGPDEEHSLAELLDEKSVELETTGLEADAPRDADLNDIADPVDRAGNEVENGPSVDPADPNLSAVMADAGAEDFSETLGMRDEQEQFLDDPEKVEDEED